MAATWETESTLTDRYQTTIPELVRRALGLNKRDKIHYSIGPGGEVALTRVQADEDSDPVLGAFLVFLARDIAAHPEQLQPLTHDLLAAVRETAAAARNIDLDAPLSADDE
jgi:antitoxin PrlF